MEVWQVGQSGLPKPFGEYAWINDIWIHEDYRHQGLIEQLAKKVCDKLPELKYWYFKRQKYGGRISKLYTVQQFKRHILEKESIYGRGRRRSTISTKCAWAGQGG